MTQAELFSPTGEALRDAGMETAARHAEEVSSGWSDRALSFLIIYAKSHLRIMGEGVRAASKGIVDQPPHLRAWGSVMMRASRAGLIEKAGYVQVENPKAHRANAALWRSKIFEGNN